MLKSLWTPTADSLTNCAMTQFLNKINAQYNLSLKDYFALHHWSVTHLAEFWQAVADFTGIKFSQSAEKIVELNPNLRLTKWFSGAKLNFAENLLSRRDQHIALITINERGEIEKISYQTLYQQVANLAHKFKELGLKAGDRIAAVLPNTAEAIIAMLAATSLGAIWSACSPDFGLEGLLDRFLQIEPKILITVDGHCYKGKDFWHAEKNHDLAAALSSVQHTLLFRHLDPLGKLPEKIIDFVATTNGDKTEIEFTQLPFDHPIYILYSSGTTGKPKCMVHGAGRVLIQHLKELKLHTNVRDDSTIFYNTTTTWMMWHWLVSNLALGATLVLFEGNIFHPTPAVLFDMIDRCEINFFGVGAKFFEQAEKLNLQPIKTHKLTSLEAILTTASPLLPTSFDYIYSEVKKDVRLCSMSGGSDLVSCFALGNPLLPVYRGELQCLGLGMDVKIFNSDGIAIKEQKGELVCAKPFPSMPIYFWGDTNGEKYQNAYFNKYPNVWTHGDYAMLTEHQGLIIFGRSDTTLNPSGVRIGSAEIYQQVEKVPGILESLVVGQQWQGGERIILFVVPKPNFTIDDDVKVKIKNQIRNNTSAHHVPAKIIVVNDIPRTANGKISEISVKKAINGEKIDNLAALANPECLQQFFSLQELQS